MKDVTSKLRKLQKGIFLLLITTGLAACLEDIPDNDRNTTADQQTRSSNTQARISQTSAGQGSSTLDEYRVATANLSPTQGNEAQGTVRFVAQEGDVLVQANLQGLARGEHAIHIHENGDCSAADASSAGGHFAPDGSPHGGPFDPDSDRHVGDLGNLQVNANGMAQSNRQDETLSLSGNDSIIGKAVIVHANSDDFSTQPAGDAGPRVACGVIQEMQRSIALQ